MSGIIDDFKGLNTIYLDANLLTHQGISNLGTSSTKVDPFDH